MAARMRYRTAPKTAKVTDPRPAGETVDSHSGLVPFAPPQEASGSWSLESYPYADPKLAEQQGTP